MPDTAESIAPKIFTDNLSGLTLVAGGANVIMQLSRLGVGRGVVESKVESGRLDKHPIKRTRTTLTYLVVAGMGTEEERNWMRQEVNRSHRPVHSGPDSPVKYNAFDRELQLWVAACIYRGYEDVYTTFYGAPSPTALHEFYAYAARFATTLQVPQDMWPVDREAFEEYWTENVKKIETDATTRAYLRSVAEVGFLPGPLRRLAAPFNRLVTVGFLPVEFRAELGYGWTPRQQRTFNASMRVLAVTNRLLPRILREFPFNAYLWDFRRRMRTGRSFV